MPLPSDPKPQTIKVDLPAIPAVRRRKDGAMFISHDGLVARLSVLMRRPDLAACPAPAFIEGFLGWLLTLETYKPAE